MDAQRDHHRLTAGEWLLGHQGMPVPSLRDFQAGAALQPGQNIVVVSK